jgi:TadE-like protein
MRTRSTRRITGSGHRRRGERGNALVEAAIVTPLIMMLVLGLVEFAMLAKDNMTISNGSRAGARVGSAAGTDPLADYNILKAVQGATGGMASIEQVIVYRASSPTGAVPSACLTGAVGGTCNVYDGSDLAISQATFQSGGYAKDDSWAAATRVTSQSAPGGPDYLGVYVKGTHNSVTHLILNSRAVKDDVIMRLEPTL